MNNSLRIRHFSSKTSSRSNDDYSFGFNGKDKESEFKSGAYDFGARIHDARLGRWMSVDPRVSENHSWSDYVYVLNNGIIFTDPTGEWPGIGIFYSEAAVCGGLGWGLNHVEQQGACWDNVGVTHFTTVSSVFLEQNLADASNGSPQPVIGAQIGFSIGFNYLWGCESFDEYIGKPLSRKVNGLKGQLLSAGTDLVKGKVSNPKLTAKCGIGVNLGKEGIGFSIGPSAGVSFSMVNTIITFSISVTGGEEDVIDNAGKYYNESWSVGNLNEVKDGNGNLVGFRGEVLADGNSTGVFVQSGVMKDKDDKLVNDNMYFSDSYLNEVVKNQNEK